MKNKALPSRKLGVIFTGFGKKVACGTAQHLLYLFHTGYAPAEATTSGCTEK